MKGSSEMTFMVERKFDRESRMLSSGWDSCLHGIQQFPEMIISPPDLIQLGLVEPKARRERKALAVLGLLELVGR
jgi:hypothetical protein